MSAILSPETIADVEAFAAPDLAVEFADTLCRFWRRDRARFTTEAVPKELLYMMLDALASVVLEGDPAEAAS